MLRRSKWEQWEYQQGKRWGAWRKASTTEALRIGQRETAQARSIEAIPYPPNCPPLRAL